jgi:hypothetical protein
MTTEYVDISLVRGPMGWGTDETLNIDTRLYIESKNLENSMNDFPVAFKIRQDQPVNDIISDKFRVLMDSKGYGKDSADMSLLDEFVFGRRMNWLPQKTGSCVISNTFRGWVRRAIFEICLKGDPEEFFGKNEFTQANFSFYAPFSYGCGRRRGKMKGGDGSWCSIQYDSLIKDGVIMCNNGRLLEILNKLKADGDKDFPEPQDNNIYRRFQNWEFLDELLPFADFRLLEAPVVKDADTHLELSRQFKPMSCCSGIAIRKIGKHKDGFDIHARDPGNSWAHNMGFHGHFESSDGKIFIRMSNESWGPNIIYNVPVEEVAKWYKTQDVSVQAIGEIDLPDSVPFI